MSDPTEKAIEAMLNLIRFGAEFVAGPVTERPDFILASENCMIRGSQNVLCKHCGKTLWMYDGFQILERFPTVPVLCLPCAAALAGKTAGSA
jgi:ribosomal protein S27E